MTVGVPNVAPPGCLNVILGVNVYPDPDVSISSLEIEPSTTVAVTTAAVEPGFVGV